MHSARGTIVMWSLVVGVDNSCTCGAKFWAYNSRLNQNVCMYVRACVYVQSLHTLREIIRTNA